MKQYFDQYDGPSSLMKNPLIQSQREKEPSYQSIYALERKSFEQADRDFG
jgi:hypothetical protein